VRTCTCDADGPDRQHRAVIEAIEAAKAMAHWSAVTAPVSVGRRAPSARTGPTRRPSTSTSTARIEINLIGTFNVCRLAATAMSGEHARRRQHAWRDW